MTRKITSITRRTPIPASASRPVVTPIYPSVVYGSDDADALDAQYEGRVAGYSYAREGHPNADVLAHNPVGKIPALITGDGAVLTDSRVICRYLNHLGGGMLYAQGAEEFPRIGIISTAKRESARKSVAISDRLGPSRPGCGGDSTFSSVPARNTPASPRAL